MNLVQDPVFGRTNVALHGETTRRRPLYEVLIEHFMKAQNDDDILADDVPEYLINSVNDLLETTLTLEET